MDRDRNLVGLYVGAIPGLSVTMAVSLLISSSFSWDVLPALAIMVGIYTGGVYGGARSGILLNIPGAPAAVTSGFDGYPLAKMGLAGGRWAFPRPKPSSAISSASSCSRCSPR